MPQLMVAMLPKSNAFNYQPARNRGVLYDTKYVFEKLRMYSDMKSLDFTGSCLHIYSSVRYSP